MNSITCTETTDLAVLTMQLLDIFQLTIYCMCTTADSQLTSRSRLEPPHIVSQGMVPSHSGHISSSLSISGLDICMVG